MKYGDKMRFNKKLFVSNILFVFCGLAGIMSAFVLNYYDIISENNVIINSIIMFISAVFCISGYIYIYKKCRHDISKLDCVIEIIFYLLFAVLFLLCKVTPGVHFSIFSIWFASLLSLVVYNIIFILEKKANQNKRVYIGKLSSKKYYYIIYYVKLWVNCVLVGMYIFAIVNVIYPNAFV